MSDKMTMPDSRNRLRRALDMLATLPVEEAQRMLATLPEQQREAVLTARAKAIQKPAGELRKPVSVAPKTPSVINIPQTYLPENRRSDNKSMHRKTSLSGLSSLPLEPLAACLMRESAEIIALVLRSLDPQKAQEIAMRLPDELGSGAAVAMARMTSPAPGVLYCIAQTLQEDVQRYIKRQEERTHGIKCIARTLSTAQHDVALEALLELGQRDAELALAVSNELDTLRTTQPVIPRAVDLNRQTIPQTRQAPAPLSEVAA